MRLLLDTQVVLWQLGGERTLGAEAVDAVAEADDLLLSVVSYAEIGVKVAAGKLTVPADLHERVRAAGVRTLSLTAAHGLAVAALPLHHRDPFDRLLVAQALAERTAVVTSDRRFADYGVPVIPAGV